MKEKTKDDLMAAFAWFAILMAIVAMCLPLGGCATQKHIEQEKVEVVREVHDTTTMYIHDTTRVTNTIHDSVDRFVKDSSWMDSLGHHYHERYVSLTKYINVQSEKYKALQQLYENTLLQMNDSIKVEYKTVEVEKKVYVWWPGIVLTTLVFGAAAYIYYRFKIRGKTNRLQTKRKRTANKTETTSGYK